MPLLTFGLSNLVVIIGAIAFASRLKLVTGTDHVVAIFILALSQIILSMLVAGVIIQRLQPAPVFIINVAI